jgi:hypothetical protein
MLEGRMVGKNPRGRPWLGMIDGLKEGRMLHRDEKKG